MVPNPKTSFGKSSGPFKGDSVTAWPSLPVIGFPNSFPKHIMIELDPRGSSHGIDMEPKLGQRRRFFDPMGFQQMSCPVGIVRIAVFPLNPLLKNMETTQLTCPPRSRHLLLLSNFMYRAYPTLRCRTRTKQGIRDLATHFRRPRRECCDRPGTAAVLMFLGMFVCKAGSSADKTFIRCGFLPVSNPWRPMGANGSFARRTSGRRTGLPKFSTWFQTGSSANTTSLGRGVISPQLTSPAQSESGTVI